MPEETNQPQGNRGRSRRERVEIARSRDILDVANELNMELVRDGKDYRWKEHDSLVISPDKNKWNWFSRHQGGDVIALVETIREINFNQAIDYLNDGTFKEFTAVEREKEPFRYHLQPYEQDFVEARNYLKVNRGLSDETIDFFLEKGVLAQANAMLNNSVEPVVVFKTLTSSGEITGATLQGIEENRAKWPARGFAKNIIRNSDGMDGLHVDIGKPNRLIFTESPIDLMSYYEINKDTLQDVRLVSMDGLKEATIGRHLAQLQSELSGRPLNWTPEQLAKGLQTAIDSQYFADGKHTDMITLAVDNDTAGRTFVEELKAKGAAVTVDLPELKQGQDKTDWNDVLKTQNEQPLVDLSALSVETVENENFSNNPLEPVWKLHGKWEDELAEKIREDLGINHELQAWQFEKEMSRFITTDLDKLFAKRTILERDAYFADSSTSIRKEIDRLDAQILEYIEKAPEQSQERLIDRTSGGTGSLQLEAEGSPTPVLETSTFEQTVTSHPTSSYPYLHFSTNYDNVQRRIGNYHPITPSDLRRLNQYAPSIQSTASWYLSELAGSKISFVYADNGEENVLQVTFLKENFIHLSGIRPFEEGKGAADFLEDFATGQGHYDSMLVSNAIKDKLQVLPMFQDILEPQSFVLDDLSSVEKLHNLNMSEAIKAKDEDFLLLFKDAEGEKIPASLMKLKGELAANVKSLDEKVILGVYRERDNQIEQLSINEEFVTDGGEEMLDNLKNQLSSLNEPSQEQKTTLSPVEKNIDAAIFTQVLDDARNVGNFVELGVTIPEEAKEAWAKYIELSDVSSGDFNTIVLKAEELGLLDKNSSFYQEWRLEDIYNNNYHVRFQWLEEQENNLKLQFEEHSLVSYQDFARELYKANQETKNNTEANISKIKFDIYAPGGEMIKEGVRFNIGDETKPISQMLGLGYRRLKGQPILANIDENVLSQLENLALNQEISHEANNPQNSLATPETDLTASPAEEKEFRSPKQETKGQLEQRVNEIVADNQKAAEEVAPAKESPGEIDYSLVSPHELSEIAFQKIREFTRSPEALAEYMDFMSKFPQLSPRNVALIQDQWQGANAVATYNQWQALGKTLGIKPEDVIETRNTYTNKRTGETKEVIHQGLSVKSGEKAQITLFRPLMAKMIPVLDDQGNQVKNSKGNPKFKKISEATTQEKALLKEGKLKVVQFQERDQETGLPKFTTYKVFELSQTTLKPESYPKAMPNRQYQFDTDQVKTKEVLDGLCDYAGTLGVRLLRDEVHELGNAKGAFYPGEQKILLNPNNLPGEQIATTIHELAHATLHNPKFTAHYKEDVSTPRKELEAEMTSHLVSKHFGLDTSEAAIDYMAGWTKNLTQLDDKQLAESMKRIHQTVSKMVKHIEHHTKPYEPPKNRGQSPNFPKSPTKGLKP
ncbi:PBECR4 domain-containing protein [Streptococcus anginosus]|uniref:PBECR4 domain-containing protein n=1 Tax=Streptococcus anginosus TaxID=1328 RepID=A0ABD4U1E6_STRAP|nr:PBECR4 domain-containing protein [Streptococcus anginosus]MCW1076422.1 PBECR4 domain-containing protein [Streptococcus anginosus]